MLVDERGKLRYDIHVFKHLAANAGTLQLDRHPTAIP
jgi:hypothetical protein